LKLVETTNGDYTLYVDELDETYHSRNGAINESKHVFIEHGLAQLDKDDIAVFELGMGTGLNALLTAIYAESNNKQVSYHTVEPYPVDQRFLDEIAYGQQLQAQELFEAIHNAPWGEQTIINKYFSLYKEQDKFEHLTLKDEAYDVIYFDAFAPKKQPELWEKENFSTLYNALTPNGILTTYAAAGHLKRNLKAVGFTLTNPHGANGKREMSVGIKKIYEE
jgi:tRNA U34 5-methylaminomethyl-2-thiouridine-forming methyltransferase MnmC